MYHDLQFSTIKAEAERWHAQGFLAGKLWGRHGGPGRLAPRTALSPAKLGCPEPTGSHDLPDPAKENCCVPAANLQEGINEAAWDVGHPQHP